MNLLLGGMAGMVCAAPVDTSKLPLPTEQPVEFLKDIKPILDQSCLKCHGDYSPKGRFSVVSRQDILQGGENGKAVMPGQSAQSPMIHYVAGLVADMEMPPSGKGNPLTSNQVALLRAWIDQGLPWAVAEEGEAPPRLTLVPYVGVVTVYGNEQKFREQHWQDQGVAGGLLDLRYREKLSDGTILSSTARVRAAEHDFDFDFAIKKPQVGSLSFGLDQFRKYFNDSGGYYDLYQPAQMRLGRDLYVDHAKAWIEATLALPDWPRVTLGYEYRRRNGTASTIQWGAVGTLPPDAYPTDVKNYYPNTRQVDDELHIWKVGLGYDGETWSVGNDFRLEYGHDQSRRDQALFYNLTSSRLERQIKVEEEYRSFSAMNALRLETRIKDWWHVSLGGMYRRHEGDAGFNSFTYSPVASYAYDDRYWRSQQLILRQDSYLGNLNTWLGSPNGLSVSAALQTEFQKQRGFGQVSLDEGLLGLFPTIQSATIDVNNDSAILEETVGLRYAGIPFLVLFAEGGFKQESRGSSEDMNGSYYEFLNRTEASMDQREARAGFTLSPWQPLSLTSHYGYRARQNRFDHLLDVSLQSLGGFPNEGYPSFIRELDYVTQEVATKLSLHINRWLKASLTHKLVETAYHTGTEVEPYGGSPGGGLLGARYHAQQCSASLTVTPHPRFYATPSVSWFRHRTTTEHNDFPAVTAWEGDTVSLTYGAHFIASEQATVDIQYQFSHANYRQDNQADGLPLGLAYDAHTAQAGLTYKWNERTSSTLRYAFYSYDEPVSSRMNNYTAHGVFLSTQITFR